MEQFNIAVIGLGIIGGSMAYALRGFHRARITGCDLSPEVREKALREKAVHRVCENAAQAVEQADLVILCTYPDTIPSLLAQMRDHLKPGAVVTDVCGVKTGVAEILCQMIPEGVDYVGGHPMAGKETEGFESASPELFWMTGFIITPTRRSGKSSVDLIYEMARYIGATRITVSSPEEHDSVIAYTSDLMHLAAAALCLDYNPAMNRAYTAGAFRDCTRVALINPELWTELFLANIPHVLEEMDRYLGSLQKLRDAIARQDREDLLELLTQVRKNKLTMQETEPKPFAFGESDG